MDNLNELNSFTGMPFELDTFFIERNYMIDESNEEEDEFEEYDEE